ncbi:MAG: deoxyribodipyrimidine photo-lyase [Rhodospirillaceae bacterium]|nr:deoxyribodipyrimidine photo-lyase [Rhodospirillaceae bacterium]
MASAPIIVWFRQDLRMTDNPALCAAVATGRPVIPLYILDQSSDGLRPMGGASLWWLHGSLESMGHHLQNLGAPLTLKKGAAKEVLGQLIAETGADTVYWNRCYEPGAIARDKAIKNTLQNDGLYAKSFNGSLLYEPWEIRTKQDKPYRMFTPFYRMVLSQGTPIQPLPKPKQIIPCDVPPKSDYLDDWSLQPTRPNWAASFPEFWSRGELGAQTLLSDFLNGGVAAYKTERDFPGVAATSRLSPHLHFGDISPRQIWASASTIEPTAGSETFLKEVVWREFGYHLLYYNPAMTTAPLQTKFNAFPWAKNDSHLVAWKTGQTGYPMIDAGMRELWATGTMHNRVRMVVASFLVKHLLIHWREGEAWFWDALVDADLASNSANWQWVSGCGADAAPYFRIFNPITQGERFDADGTYVRRWVPEIAGVSNQYIHKPWDAPKATLLEAGVSLGDTYPRPIVDHKVARKKALAALASIKQAD